MSDRWTITSYRLLVLGIWAVSAQALAEQDLALRDPTMPSGWQAPVAAEDAGQAPPLRLQGTFSIAGARSALIDGQRVSVGDQVAGAEVVQIDRNKVILRIDGQTVELASLGASVKTPVKKAGDLE